MSGHIRPVVLKSAFVTNPALEMSMVLKALSHSLQVDSGTGCFTNLGIGVRWKNVFKQTEHDIIVLEPLTSSLSGGWGDRGARSLGYAWASGSVCRVEALPPPEGLTAKLTLKWP